MKHSAGIVLRQGLVGALGVVASLSGVIGGVMRSAGAQVVSVSPMTSPDQPNANGETGTPNAFDDLPSPLEFAHKGCGKACVYRGLFEQGLQPGQLALRSSLSSRSLAPTDPTDVLNNSLSLSVNPPSAAISGNNTMTIRAMVDNLTTFTFRLRSNLTVTSCTVTDAIGSYSVTPSSPPVNNSSYGRTITFSRPIPINTVFTVSISYSGTPATLGFGNFTAGTINGNNIVCTLSQPYYAGTWWPCKDGDVLQAGDNADKATLNIAIDAPSLYQSTSNGVRVGVDVNTPSTGRTRYRFASVAPMATYLVCFSTSVYNSWTRTYDYGTGTMPVEFNINPGDDTPTNRRAWELSLDMLAAFRPIFGLYPFINEKYGIYQFNFGGGEEHQTNSGQGISGSTPFLEFLTAHELGHQWWGDNVTCRYWNDIWLNEGFATYCEALWEERKPGSSGLPALRSAMQARKPNNPTNTVYVPSSSLNSVSRIFDGNSTYDKAGWVVHMLRRIMGDTTFSNALAAYRSAFEGSAATTSDFTTIMSNVAGQDLSWFFNPWVFGSGAPAYTFAAQTAFLDGKDYLRLSIAQSNTTGTALFDMPIDVQFTASGGSQLVTVRNDAAKTYHLIPVASAPNAASVVLDPNGWVLEYGKNAGTYTQGPPKIITLNPAPGSSQLQNAGGGVTSVRIAFSDAVNALAAQFALNRSINGGSPTPVPFTLSYDTLTQVATLNFASPLGAGVYSVVVSDALTSTIGSIALDGELAGNAASALPSGNGTAGGSATYSFTVTAPLCPPDFNNDTAVDVQDIFAFLAAWFAKTPGADFNNDTAIDVQDIFAFLAAWFARCP